MRVVGSIKALGGWDPKNGLLMATTAADFPTWSAVPVDVEEDEVVEYKYVICDLAGVPERWEERPNRCMHLASVVTEMPENGQIIVSEPFNGVNTPDKLRFKTAEESMNRKGSRSTLNLCDMDIGSPSSEKENGEARQKGETDLFAPTIRERRMSHSIASSRAFSSAVGGNDEEGDHSDSTIANIAGDKSGNRLGLAREESSSNLFLMDSEEVLEQQADVESSAHFADQYTLVGDGPLGEGTFGLVWRCTHKRSPETSGEVEERAAKIVKKARLSARDHRHLLGNDGEVRTHLTMNHPHVVRLYEYFDEQATVTLVLEWCRGGDLFDTIVKQAEASRQEQNGLAFKRGLSENAAAIVMQHITSALAYIHSQKVVHRDIKCENVLLARIGVPVECNVFKLCDFGFAAHDTGDGLCDRLGSPDTVAPEVVLGLRYSTPADIWSVGVLLYMMLSATPPFFASTDGEVLRRVRSGNYRMDDRLWDTISAPCKDMIRTLMTVHAVDRPTAEEVFSMAWLRSRGLSPPP